jgi:hypothetical protein
MAKSEIGKREGAMIALKTEVTRERNEITDMTAVSARMTVRETEGTSVMTERGIGIMNARSTMTTTTKIMNGTDTKPYAS